MSIHRKAEINSDWAFTLTEMLVVVAIIGILAVLVIPNVLDAKARGAAVQCQANLRAIETAKMAYLGDHQGATAVAGADVQTQAANLLVYMPGLSISPTSPGEIGQMTFPTSCPGALPSAPYVAAHPQPDLTGSCSYNYPPNSAGVGPEFDLTRVVVCPLGLPGHVMGR